MSYKRAIWSWFFRAFKRRWYETK